MRYTVARVVRKYDFKLAAGWDGLNMESDKVDRFTALPGCVPLSFSLRD